MKIFGFDISFAYECVCDVYNLLSAYKTMCDKKVERIKATVADVKEAETVEEGAENERS